MGVEEVIDASDISGAASTVDELFWSWQVSQSLLLLSL